MQTKIKRAAAGHYTQATNEELLGWLVASSAKIAAELTVMARCYHELEKRGVKVPNINSRLADMLRGIATGTVLPEVVAAYGYSPMLSERLIELPLQTQQQLVDDKTVPVVRQAVDGTLSVRNIALPDLSLRDIAKVFGDGEVRTVGKQKALFAENTGTKCEWLEVPMTPAEYTKLQRAAINQKESMCELARQAMREKKLI